MRQSHHLSAAVLASIALMVVTPVSAAQGKQTDSQTSVRLGTAEQSGAATTTDLNRDGLRATQTGSKQHKSMEGAPPARQTAQLTAGAKAKAIRRAIAIRRARARKAQQAGNS